MKTPVLIGLSLSPTFVNGLNMATDVLRAAYPMATDAELLERIFVSGICATIDAAERDYTFQLRITGCRDSMMWYAGMVGQTVPYLGRWPESFKSREPAGFINRVEFHDAQVEIV